MLVDGTDVYGITLDLLFVLVLVCVFVFVVFKEKKRKKRKKHTSDGSVVLVSCVEFKEE